MKRSIQILKDSLDRFKESFDNFILYEKKNKDRNVNDIFYQEYSVKDFEEQWNYIISIINHFVNNHKWFFIVVSQDDINELVWKMNNCTSYLNHKYYNDIITYFSLIKQIIWKYNAQIFLKKEYSLELSEEILKTQNLFKELKNNLFEIEGDLDKKNLIIQNIDDLEERYVELEQKISKIEEKDSYSDELILWIENNQEKIMDFISKIDERERVFNTQNDFMRKYENKIYWFEKQFIEKLWETKKLIKSAKEALNYKTAEGISAAIQSQYDESKKDLLLWWLYLSAIFLCLALIIWFFTLFPDVLVLIFSRLGLEIQVNWELNLYSFIARFSFIILLMWASIFSSKQYIKQKNIIEDYAYKLVLAKSIIWFSEELKKWWEEWYQKYITKTLEELLQDPLRNKNINIKDDKSDLSQLKEWIGIMKEAKELLK